MSNKSNRELVYRKIPSLLFNYEITSNGRYIRNVKSKKQIRIQISNRGYHVVTLYLKKKRKSYRVARLVAECWVPNYNNYPEVDHIDRNKLNDDFTNLRWCTRSMNSKNRQMTEAWRAHCIELAQNQKGKEVWINDEYFPTLTKAAHYLAEKHNKSVVAMKGRLNRRSKYILGDIVSYTEPMQRSHTMSPTRQGTIQE